ncbi:MAG: hypothetical protein DI556_05960 [Rhodovulum sulfidophilum]|uniref:Uncharacterized protein n=1 Tax=Rhodovulum sulfidophilum TaxID=35806 RepID=A0A2W5Q7I2_RHOSU|nr:MAG: hypothetical protein DI556_05960 [Rhodovulum sulfidophilum]
MAPIVMVATGVGITPFIGLLESLLNAPRRPEMRLLYGSRNQRGHIFAERIAGYRERMPELDVTRFLGRPDATDRIGVDYDIAGRVDAGVPSDEFLARRPRFHVRGSQPMIDAFSWALVQRGVPAFDIFSEVFVSPRAPAMDGDQTYKVRFSRSGALADRTPRAGALPRLAERSGINAPSGCRVGQCENCAVSILAGEVAHFGPGSPYEPGIALTFQKGHSVTSSVASTSAWTTRCEPPRIASISSRKLSTKPASCSHPSTGTPVTQ